MFSTEVAQLLPQAIVWSPTNTRNQFDHEIIAPGVRALVFECKGVESAEGDPLKRWMSPIYLPQLRNYLNRSLPVLYVLPAKPRDPERPWIRRMHSDQEDGQCQSCRRPRARRSARNSPAVKGAPIHHRFQPWFAHWCWVIPAAGLHGHLDYREEGRKSVVAEDTSLAKLPDARRLCRFLADVGENRPYLKDFWVYPSASVQSLTPLGKADVSGSEEAHGAKASGLLAVLLPTPMN